MAVGNGYSSTQILSMQKDAIRRVNEMQRVSQERLQRTQETMGDAPASGSLQSSPPSHGQGESSRLAPSRQGEPMYMPDHRFNRSTRNSGQTAQRQGGAESPEPEARHPGNGRSEQELPRQWEEPRQEESLGEERVPSDGEGQFAAGCTNHSGSLFQAAGSSPENPFKGILQRLGLDQETTLVLLLLLLLVNEGADSKLIMALVYILL